MVEFYVRTGGSDYTGLSFIVQQPQQTTTKYHKSHESPHSPQQPQRQSHPTTTRNSTSSFFAAQQPDKCFSFCLCLWGHCTLFTAIEGVIVLIDSCLYFIYCKNIKALTVVPALNFFSVNVSSAAVEPAGWGEFPGGQDCAVCVCRSLTTSAFARCAITLRPDCYSGCGAGVFSCIAAPFSSHRGAQ